MSAVLFVLSVCAMVYFLRGLIRVWRSPEFKRDMEWLRENRRRRIAARRKW